MPERFDEADAAALRRYLLSFDWPRRDAAVEEMIVGGGLPLWREILTLVPPRTGAGRLLELGSPPFHTSLLVQKLRGYEITPTAGVLDERRTLTQTVHSKLHGEEHSFDCACFDLEHERFPFADGAFDVVLFCEVIEHLFENPVFTLSEIHRVLRPGGTLIVSTPNAARSGNLMRLWFGANVFDAYHLGSPLRGSRHSREYTMAELAGLIGGCGFGLEVAAGRNLGQIQYTRRTRKLEPVFRLLTRFAFGEHADHLFVRAVRGDVFRWHFPREIFDEGHLRWYTDVRDDALVAGENDVPHTTGFWGPLEIAGGAAARRVEMAGGDVHLLARRPARGVRIEVVGEVRTRLTAAAWHGPVELGTGVGDAPGVVEVLFRNEVPAEALVRIEVRATPAALVRSVRLVS